MSWLKQFRWYQIIKPKETKDICDALQVGQKTWYLLLVAQILLIPTSLIDVIIIKIVTDKVMIDGNSQLLAPVLFISGGIIILAMGFEALISYHAIRLSQFWDGLMKGRFLRNILFKPLIFFQQIPSGEILYRLLNDLGTLPSYMTSMRWNLLTNIVMAVAMVIVLLYLDMPLALILFVFIPFQIWALRYLGQKCRLLQEQLKLQDQQLLGNLDNITVNAESLKAFAFESHACHNWFSQYRSRLLTERRLMVLQNIFAVLVMRLSSFAFLLSVCFGGYRVAT